MKEKNRWYCEWAPSLGDLERDALSAWGTPPYEQEKHINENVVFFGLYGFPSFYKLWKHEGKRYILWAGSDILHLKGGYHLEDGGGLALSPQDISVWINKHCENWVENTTEQDALKELGIRSQVCPSYMGSLDIPITFKPALDYVKVYASASNDPNAYGWPTIERIAGKVPFVDFHLYGIDGWRTEHKNVVTHGRVPKEKMNKEIANMQGALRLNRFDGCSEILVKAVLQGQYPLVRVPHPKVDTFTTDDDIIDWLHKLKDKTEPNTEARNWYLTNLNRYPWNEKY